MSSTMSIIVLLAIFLVTFDHVECAKCYACTSWESACKGRQNPKTSPSLDCTERYGGPCAELNFHHFARKPVTIRFCLPVKELPNCDVIRRRVTNELKGWKMANCTLCETDFCNGNSFA